MGQVVLGVQPSVHAAYHAQAAPLGVADHALEDTWQHVALGVSAALVRDAARQAAPGLGAPQAAWPPLGPGYRTNRRAGHQRAARDQRRAALRWPGAAPGPGPMRVVREPQSRLATEVVRGAAGHAQARSWGGPVLPLVAPDALWSAARHFGPVDCWCGRAARGGCVVIRPPGPRQGPGGGARPSRGAMDTGQGYAPPSRLGNAPGAPWTLRRVTVAWHEPTRDGATAGHGLSNVPGRQARAHKLAEASGQRWTMESMGQGWPAPRTGAVKARGYPRAALVGFCLAVRADNAVSVMQAALRAVHGRATVPQDISAYDRAWEISQTDDGMLVASPRQPWTSCRTRHAKQLADVLTELAAPVNRRRYKTHPRSPQKQPTARTADRRGGHVSTATILAMRT